MVDHGCFNCVISHVKVLYRLAGEERRNKERKNNSVFRLFQVGHLRIVSGHCLCYCRLGQHV